MPSRKAGAEGAISKKGPEAESDVEGHSRRRLDTKATAPADEPGTNPESARQRIADEDDVEGHNFGHNAMLSRNAAQTRERDVQRNLRNHEVKSEARRPFFKKG